MNQPPSFDGGREWVDTACPAVQLLDGHKVRPTDTKDVMKAGSVVYVEVAAPVLGW